MTSLTELYEKVGVKPDVITIYTEDGTQVVHTEPFLTHEQQSKLIRVLLQEGVEFSYSKNGNYMIEYGRRLWCNEYLEDCIVEACEHLVDLNLIDHKKIKVILSDDI